jgi:hypothetical protein
MNFDEGFVAPESFLKCGEGELCAAPVLLSIRNEELFVLCDNAPGLDSDLETSMLLIPHAVLKGLVQRIVDVPHHTEYFTERVAPGITNEGAELDRVVGEISGMIDLFSGQLFTAVVLAHNGIIMVKSIEGTRGKKAKISSWNSRGRYIGVRLGRIRNVYRMTRTSWEWSRGSALDRGAWT